MYTFLAQFTTIFSLIACVCAEPAPLPQFETLFSGPLLIGQFNSVTGPLGVRLNAPVLGGNLSDSSGNMVATIMTGPGAEHGIVAADGTFFPDARITLQWTADQKFAYIDAHGVGQAGVKDMFYAHLETDSPTWNSLNARFIIANLTFGEPSPTLTFFGVKSESGGVASAVMHNQTPL
ncbi:hypothetical protein OBBRIDRAFT_891896 [Obba rivulosa]|uniref:Uncharacterized protein n=1 Tax=Obba rivulosa TaxID=1052685 RepID=A0A8E2DIZ9_9APHY|nr:hypothetical protein OBBRIDRAFT_891896 [Obba rivulosa]